ncbi:unnamed protein product [Discula destructiva]
MASRLADLEKTVVRAKEFSPVNEQPQRDAHVANKPGPMENALYAGPPGHGARGDILVQKGSSSQYFNEMLISKVMKEERCIESVLTPQTSSPGLSVPAPINALGILSTPILSSPPGKFHPLKHQAVKLWNIFTEPVQACAGLKLLHIPTDEVKVFSVIDNPFAAPLEDVALCFAIYFASTASMESAEAERLLGQDIDTALLQFKVGLEQAFAHGDFLDQPTITGLHALAVYVAALRSYSRGKGIWILNGLAIRIAKSLGLHRDGTRLGLSPFQSEIRRRLWWHLLCRDARAGEDYGLESTNSPLLQSDVNLPANINDTDLDPDMKEPPVPRTGWTPMTLSLTNIDHGRTIEKLASLAASSTPSSPPSEETRLQILHAARARTDAWIAVCNPVVPQQLLTRQCALFLLRKVGFVTKLQWILLRQRAGSHEEFATEENLEEALEILDLKMSMGYGVLGQFSWTKRAYPQYNVTMYVLLHLCVKPEGPNVERAWEAVTGFFEGEMRVGDNVGYGPKLSVLAALREKATAVREKIHIRRPGGSLVRDGDHSMGVDCSEDSAEVASLPVNSEVGNSVVDEFGLGTMDDWPDWATLVQDFQLDTSDVFLQ